MRNVNKTFRKKKQLRIRHTSIVRRVARNSQRWGCHGGLGLAAGGGQWGSGFGLVAGGRGFGGKAPSRRRHGGLGALPPALETFAFFLQK